MRWELGEPFLPGPGSVARGGSPAEDADLAEVADRGEGAEAGDRRDCGCTMAVTASGETSSTTGSGVSADRGGSVAVTGQGTQLGGQRRVVLSRIARQFGTDPAQLVHEFAAVRDAGLRVACGAGGHQGVEVVGDEAWESQFAKLRGRGGHVDVHVRVGDLVVVLADVWFFAGE